MHCNHRLFTGQLQKTASSYWPAFLPRFVLGLHHAVYLLTILHHFHLINVGGGSQLKEDKGHTVGKDPSWQSVRGEVARMRQEGGRSCLAVKRGTAIDDQVIFHPKICSLMCFVDLHLQYSFNKIPQLAKIFVKAYFPNSLPPIYHLFVPQ